MTQRGRVRLSVVRETTGLSDKIWLIVQCLRGYALSADLLSGFALVVSIGSLIVSIMTYRSEWPRVSVARHSITIHDDELWLQVQLVNAGKGEVDINGATCDLMGPCVSHMSYRLKAAASYDLMFRAPLTQGLARANGVTVNIGMGNGRSLVSQLQLTDHEQAAVRLALARIEAPARTSRRVAQPTRRHWLPPTQDEVR